jgi:hypothetical protein
VGHNIFMNLMSLKTGSGQTKNADKLQIDPFLCVISKV